MELEFVGAASGPMGPPVAPTRNRFRVYSCGYWVGAAIFAAIENRIWIIAVGTAAPTFAEA